MIDQITSAMWTCPKCHHKFYNINQSHSCGSYTVEDFLAGKSAKAIALFHEFIAAYHEIGDFELHPVKSRVALLTQMRFCSVNKIGLDFIDLHFVLTQPYSDNTCFYKIENLGNRFYIHNLRLYDRADIDSEVRSYMELAYEVGNRKHVSYKSGIRKKDS